MEITQIRIFPVHEDKLKAFVSVIFDNCFVVSDIKIIEGQSGLFVSMPSKRRKNGTFRDIAHPLNNETRRRFEEQIITKFREVVAQSGGTTPAPLRELSAETAGDDDEGPAPADPQAEGPDNEEPPLP